MSLSLSRSFDVSAGPTGPASTDVELDRLLSQLCDLAGHSVPGVEAAAVVLVRHGVPVRQVSQGFARAVDRIQYGTGEGPCVDAAAQRCIVVSGCLGAGEPRWPQFVAGTRPLAVVSVLSLPLAVDRQVLGSVNLYSRRLDAFDSRAVTAGERFAGPAAASVSAVWSAFEADPADADEPLPAPLVHGIEAAVAGVATPAQRSAAISRLVEELYRTLAWTVDGPAGRDELCSFAQVLAAVYAHQDRVAASTNQAGVR